MNNNSDNIDCKVNSLCFLLSFIIILIILDRRFKGFKELQKIIG